MHHQYYVVKADDLILSLPFSFSSTFFLEKVYIPRKQYILGEKMTIQIQTQIPSRNRITVHNPYNPETNIELTLNSVVATVKFVEVTARVEVCWKYYEVKCRSYEGIYRNRSTYGNISKIFEILDKIRDLGTKEWLKYVTSTCRYCADLDTHIYLSLCRRHLSAYQVFDGARFFTGARLWQTSDRGLVLELRRITGCRMKTCECWIFEDGSGICYVYWDNRRFKFRSHGYPSTYNYLVSRIKNDLRKAMELTNLGSYTYRVEEKKGWLTGDWYPRTECDAKMLSLYDSF